MDNIKIGEFIAFLRKNKGLTQKELGKKLSVTDKAISKWERGLSLPDITLLNSLAKVLDVDVSEILNGEYANTNTVDVRQEVHNTIQHINSKRNRIIRNIFIVLLVISFIFIILFVKKDDYNKDKPDKIVEGENHYELKNYNLEKNGLDEIINIISMSENMPQKYCVAYFEARLNTKGNVTKFTLSLNAFDDNENYIGLASFQYENNTITYHKPKNDHLDLVEIYSRNSNIDYISEQLKKIPLNKQIELSELKFYFVTYQPDTNIELDTPDRKSVV